MNRCLYCEAVTPAFRAFCTSTCEGLFGMTGDDCTACHEPFRHAGYTPTGVTRVGCACGDITLEVSS